MNHYIYIELIDVAELLRLQIVMQTRTSTRPLSCVNESRCMAWLGADLCRTALPSLSWKKS
jgi:hypothetical protein